MNYIDLINYYIYTKSGVFPKGITFRLKTLPKDNTEELVFVDWTYSFNAPAMSDLNSIYTSDFESKLSKARYYELRQNYYPSLSDQLDMLYHDRMSGTTTWVDTIKAIKDKYPKA